MLLDLCTTENNHILSCHALFKVSVRFKHVHLELKINIWYRSVWPFTDNSKSLEWWTILKVLLRLINLPTFCHANKSSSRFVLWSKRSLQCFCTQLTSWSCWVLSSMNFMDRVLHTYKASYLPLHLAFGHKIFSLILVFKNTIAIDIIVTNSNWKYWKITCELQLAKSLMCKIVITFSK